MPLPLVALAIGATVAQGGLSYIGGKNADKKAKELAEHDSELIKQQAEFQIDAILEGKVEAEKGAITRMSDLSRKAMIERGRILAASGESGVAGASISGQLLNTYQQESESKGRVLYNLGATKRQLSRDIGAVQAGLQINLPKAQKLSPSLGGAIFSTGIASLQAYIGTQGK